MKHLIIILLTILVLLLLVMKNKTGNEVKKCCIPETIKQDYDPCSVTCAFPESFWCKECRKQRK